MKYLLSILFSACLLASCVADKAGKEETSRTLETAGYESVNLEPYDYAEIVVEPGVKASMRTRSSVYRTSDSRLTLILRLPTARTTTGRHYALEKFHCGEWQPVPSKLLVFDDEFILAAPCEVLFDLPLSGYVAPLHPGKYRIVKEIRNGQRMTTLTAEFMLWKE